MFCTHCGHELSPEDKFCTGCGAPVDGPEPSYKEDQTRPLQSAPAAYDNGAANRASRQVPGRFNWGAFSLTLIWGIGNRCYITLLCLVPIVGFVMPFVAGFKGNAWPTKTIATATWKNFPKCRTRGIGRASSVLSRNYLSADSGFSSCFCPA